MPVNDTNVSVTASTSSSATVQLYYYNSGSRTADAGQAAGTVVDATFVHRNILNSLGTNVATANDTSLAYTCLALTTELEIAAQPEIAALIEGLDNQTPSTRAAQVGALLKNGEFIIDYRRGLLIGKKATTASTMTSVTYKYSTGVTVTVDSEFPAAAALADGTANPTTTTTGANMFGYNGSTWDRIRSGITAATATLTGWLNTLPWAVYNATAPTKTDGQGNPLQSDSLGNLQSNLYTKIAGEDLTNDVMKVEEQMSYAGITLAAPTTTVVKSGAGMLHCIQINKAAANGVITIYDNTAASGTVIATITMPAALLANQNNLYYDVKFSTGLTIVTSTAAQDITVSYR